MDHLSLVFSIATNAVLVPWLLLVVCPTWRWTQRLVHSAPVIALWCLVYLALHTVRAESPPGASLTSFEGFLIGVSSPWGAIITWIHILVVDLFVGAWILRDARRLAISHLWVAPCLVATFVLAPIGLLAYFAVRFLLAGALSLHEEHG